MSEIETEIDEELKSLFLRVTLSEELTEIDEELKSLSLKMKFEVEFKLTDRLEKEQLLNLICLVPAAADKA
jgi:hypothetical protein